MVFLSFPYTGHSLSILRAKLISWSGGLDGGIGDRSGKRQQVPDLLDVFSALDNARSVLLNCFVLVGNLLRVGVDYSLKSAYVIIYFALAFVN